MFLSLASNLDRLLQAEQIEGGRSRQVPADLHNAVLIIQMLLAMTENSQPHPAGHDLDDVVSVAEVKGIRQHCLRILLLATEHFPDSLHRFFCVHPAVLKIIFQKYVPLRSQPLRSSHEPELQLAALFVALTYAGIVIGSGDPSSDVEYLEMALKISDNIGTKLGPVLHFYLGESHIRRDERKLGIHHYEEAVNLESRSDVKNPAIRCAALCAKAKQSWIRSNAELNWLIDTFLEVHEIAIASNDIQALRYDAEFHVLLGSHLGKFKLIKQSLRILNEGVLLCLVIQDDLTLFSALTAKGNLCFTEGIRSMNSILLVEARDVYEQCMLRPEFERFLLLEKNPGEGPCASQLYKRLTIIRDIILSQESEEIQRTLPTEQHLLELTKLLRESEEGLDDLSAVMKKLGLLKEPDYIGTAVQDIRTALAGLNLGPEATADERRETSLHDILESLNNRWARLGLSPEEITEKWNKIGVEGFTDSDLLDSMSDSMQVNLLAACQDDALKSAAADCDLPVAVVEAAAADARHKRHVIAIVRTFVSLEKISVPNFEILLSSHLSISNILAQLRLRLTPTQWLHLEDILVDEGVILEGVLCAVMTRRRSI